MVYLSLIMTIAKGSHIFHNAQITLPSHFLKCKDSTRIQHLHNSYLYFIKLAIQFTSMLLENIKYGVFIQNL